MFNTAMPLAFFTFLLFATSSPAAIELEDYRKYFMQQEHAEQQMNFFLTDPESAKLQIERLLHANTAQLSETAIVDSFNVFSIYFTMLKESQGWNLSERDRELLSRAFEDPTVLDNARMAAATVLYIDSGNITYMVRCLRDYPLRARMFQQVHDTAFEQIVRILLAEALAWEALFHTHFQNTSDGLSEKSKAVLSGSYTAVGISFLTFVKALQFQNASTEFLSRFVSSWSRFIRGGEFSIDQLFEFIAEDSHLQEVFLREAALDDEKLNLLRQALDKEHRSQMMNAVLDRLKTLDDD